MSESHFHRDLPVGDEEVERLLHGRLAVLVAQVRNQVVGGVGPVLGAGSMGREEMEKELWTSSVDEIKISKVSTMVSKKQLRKQ